MADFRTHSTQFIGGVWRAGSGDRVLTDRNPFDASAITEFRIATVADVDEAYQTAKVAQGAWDRVNPYAKRAVLEDAVRYVESHRNEITEIIIDELGGTPLKAGFEIGLVIDALKEASTLPLRMEGRILPSPIDDKENRLYRVPVGVVGVVSPFNFPFFLTMKSVAPAIATGNGVVIKPHEETPITGGTLIGRIFEEAGVPSGLLGVTVTDIQEIGDAFIEHPVPRVISFTGSTEVGNHIGQVAMKNFKRPLLEMGGNSAMIVLEDADLGYAIDAAVFSRFTHQGQVCMSANRILVHRDLYDDFLKGFVERVSTLPVGDPRESDTVIGPLINERQAQRLDATVEAAIEDGARPLLRGSVAGALMEPVVLADVTPAMSVAHVEMFGPAVCVMRFDSEEEAIKVANDTPFGLSGAIHTQNIERGVRLARLVDTGMIHINDATIHDEPIIPFGGEKESGLGRLNGEYSLDAFTSVRWVSVHHSRRQFPY